MRLELAPERQERIEYILRVLVVIAAIATIPLTAAYWFEWQGWWVFIGDWAVWLVFLVEYTFLMAVSTNRWTTTKQQWMSVLIIIVSFPIMPELLALSRLARLVRPLRALVSFRLGQQLHLLRLSSVRSAGSQVIYEKLEQYRGGQGWIAFLKRIVRRVPGFRRDS